MTQHGAPGRSTSRRRTAKRNQKIAVLAATGLIVASGATITSLAAWSDTEWVFGGAGTQNSVSASVFEVNQNVTADLTDTNWTNDLASPGGRIDFSIAAQSLYPEVPVYGYVRLRTTVKSLAGDLTLNAPALAPGGDADLFAALQYGAKIVSSPAACTSAGYAVAGNPVVVASGTATSVGSADGAFELAAGTATLPGAEKVVCFELVLPAQLTDALQGKIAQPIWNFTAESKL